MSKFKPSSAGVIDRAEKQDGNSRAERTSIWRAALNGGWKRAPAGRPGINGKRPSHSFSSTTVVATPTSEYTAPPSQAEDASANSGQHLALVMAMLFLFFRFSFLHEVLTTKIGFDTHLLLLIGVGAIVSTLLAGSLFIGFSHRICLAWLGFAGCMCLATVTSIWKGGSFGVLFPYLRTTLLLVILIPAVALRRADIVKVLKWVGFAGIIPILLGLLSDDYRSGRLELSGAGRSIENSNDFAALLILVLPAIAYLTLRKETKLISKIIGLASIGLACFLILGTGSRGALVSILISIIYILKAGSGKVRLAILVGLPVLALVALPFIPGQAAQRLGSLFNSADQTQEAVDSQAQRTALLKASLQITATHPISGVGPGTFSIYQARVAAGQGVKGMWHETHNSYTQVSSECGIPAACFYIAAIFMSFRVFRRGMKSSDPALQGVSQILALMLVSFSICMFFLSQAYGFGFPVLGGFAIALDRLLNQETATPAVV